MAKYTFTVTSATGAAVNPVTGASTDSIAVYSDAELRQRKAAAASDPRKLTVSVRRLGKNT